MLSELQASEEGLKEVWRECLERAEVAESAQQVLEEEHARVQGELAAQESHVEELERRVAEERARREEEVDKVEQQLEQERRNRRQDVEKYSQAIAELKTQVRVKGCIADQVKGILEKKNIFRRVIWRMNVFAIWS